MANMNTATATKTLTKLAARKLMRETTDAYSFHYYDMDSWTRCILMLSKRGYNRAEIIAILYSKLTRLAADSRSQCDNLATAYDLGHLLDKCAAPGTFDQDYATLQDYIDDHVLYIVGADYMAAQTEAPVYGPRLVWSNPQAAKGTV